MDNAVTGIREAFTVSPEVVYSPIVPVSLFKTNKFDPDTAIPNGVFNHVITLTVAPEVVYSPIESPPKFVTNRFDPDTAMKIPPKPRTPETSNPVISEAFTVSPEVVYSPIVPVTPDVLATNKFPPDTAILHG